MIADLLGGAFDHAMTLAGVRRQYLPGAGDLEALFGTRPGFDLGHLALLIMAETRNKPVLPDAHGKCVLIELSTPPRQPFSAGRRAAGLWQRRPEKTTISGRSGTARSAGPGIQMQILTLFLDSGFADASPGM